MATSPGYIFGGNTGVTQDDLARRRQYVRAMFERAGNQTPRNVGEGLNAIGSAIAARFAYNALQKDEDAYQGKVDGSLAGMNDFLGSYSPGGGSALAYDPAGSSASSGSSSPKLKSSAADNDNGLSPYQTAFLDTLAGPESAGAYNVVYGGKTFDDFADHPRQAVPIGSGPNAGKTSSAAGRYQFLGSTWDEQRSKLGLTDFSPASQDRAAYALAADTYKAKTGRSLDDVLQSNDPDAIAGVGQALSGVWTSLPGGIEQGTSAPRFTSSYQSALGRNVSQRPSQVASLDPSFMPSGGGGADRKSVIRNAVLGQGDLSGLRGAVASLPPQPAAGAEIDPREVPGLLARRDPQAVPYSGPGATIDPREIPALLNRTPEQQQAGYNRAMSAAASSPANVDRLAYAGGNQPMAPVDPTAGRSQMPSPLPGFSPAVQRMTEADPGFDGFARSGGRDGGAGFPAVPPEPTQPGASPGQQDVAAAPGQAPPQPAAGYDTSNIRKLSQLLNDPYLPEQQRSLAASLLGQEFASRKAFEDRQAQNNDPDTLLDRRLKQAQIEAATGKSAGYRTLTTDEAAQMGLPPGAVYQMSPTGQIDPIGDGKGQQINVTTGSDSGDFFKEADKARGKSFVDAADAGSAAQRSLIQIDELDRTLANVGTGGLAAMKQFAGSYGLPVGDLSDSQAATALINTLIPAQRPPGSGSMSDRDVEMFKASLPSIVNQPGGNARIIQTMRGIAQYDAARGDIANRVLDREITPAQGRKAMAELPNPLAEFRKANGAGSPSSSPAPGAAAPPATAATPRRARNPQTGQILELQGNQWVPVQ